MELSINDLSDVRAAVLNARTKWYDIGLALKVPVTTLDSTDDQFDNHSDKLREMLKIWLKTAAKPAWKDILDVLKSPVVGEPTLASEIEAKHCITAETGQASEQRLPKVQLPQQPTVDAQLHTLQQALQDSQRRTAEFQQNLLQLEQTNRQLQETVGQLRRDLQQTVEEKQAGERQLQELQQQLIATEQPQKALMQQKTIRDMKWQKESRAPKKICRGSAASDSNMAYFNGHDSTEVYSYDSDTQKWIQLPDTPHTRYTTLVVVQHILTMVGGYLSHKVTNSLLSLMGEGGAMKWLPHFPAMPTARHSTAAVCSGHSLIIAGGVGNRYNRLATVEVLDIDTQQWSTACSLPHPLYQATISICHEWLYLMGGLNNTGRIRSVLTCSVPELLQSQTEKLRIEPAKHSTKWRFIADAPHYLSSCATLCGQLVAVGGWDGDKETTTIFIYNQTTDSWEAMGDMPTARHSALVAILNGKLMVVGGIVGGSVRGWPTDVVEMLR